MAVSFFDLFKVDIGPSSSISVGPVRAALMFTPRLASEGTLGSTNRFKFELEGSLEANGNGNDGGLALLLGLAGSSRDTVGPAAISASRSPPAQHNHAVVLRGQFLGSGERTSNERHHFGIVVVGGQTADDRRQDIRGQTQQTLAKIEKVLAAAGTEKSRLLAAQIWLKDIKNDFAVMDEVWDAWTAPHSTSTRATAQREMGSPDTLVEIIVAAAVGKAGA